MTPTSPRFIHEATDEELLVLIAQCEQDIGSDHGTHVMFYGRRTLIHDEITARLLLDAEQSISVIMMKEILDRTALILERDAVEAAMRDGVARTAPTVRLAYKREYSDYVLSMMGQAEREMDAGTRTFVIYRGMRITVQQPILDELKLKNGQLVDEPTTDAIMHKQQRARAISKRTSRARKIIRCEDYGPTPRRLSDRAV